MNDPLSKQIARFAGCIQKLRQYNLAVEKTANTLQDLPGAKARENGLSLSRVQQDQGVPLETTLKNIAERVQQEASKLKQQATRVTDTIDKLQDENRALRDDLDSLEVSVQSKRKEIRRLELENSNLREQIQTHIPNHSQELEELRAELRLAKKANLKLGRGNKTLQEEQVEMQEKIEELNEEVGLIKKCKQCQKRVKHNCVIRGGAVSFPARQ